MEPNQYQSRRTDYSAVPVNRPYARPEPLPRNNNLPTVQPTPAAQTTISTDPAVPLSPLQPPVPVVPPVEAVATIDANPPVVASAPPERELPLAVSAQENPQPIPPPPLATVAEPTAFPPLDTTARPYQIKSPPPPRPRAWKTQKFWLITSSIVFILLTILGAWIGYKATHHEEDVTLPVTVIAGVDTSDDITTVGSTEAERTANDQRQKAMLAMRDKVEAYYVTNGYYPTTAQMSDKNWALTNLEGVKVVDLQDPNATVAGFVGVPVKGKYAYRAGYDKNMGVCDNVLHNCNYYQLTATLSDNSLYVKGALR